MATYNIVTIKQGKNDFYTLTIQKEDGVEELQVSGGTLVEANLLSPRALTHEEYRELKKVNEFSIGYQKAIHYISYRKRSHKEVEQYLQTKTMLPSNVAQQIIKKLMEKGYVNDREFIASYIRDSFITSVKGPQKIQFDLQNKFGCSENDIQEVMKLVYTTSEEKEQAYRFVQKMLKKKYASISQAHKKILQKGYEAGYSQNMIQPILEEFQELIQIEQNKMMKKLERDYQKAIRKEPSEYELKHTLIQKICQQQLSYFESTELVEKFLEDKKVNE